MSYPVVLNGVEGEQFNNYDSRRWPLGTRMALQDGRRFAFCDAAGSPLVAGRVQQSAVPQGNFDTLVTPTSEVAGSREVAITTGATAVTANLFDGGFLIPEAAAGAGDGFLYKIDDGVVAIGTTSNGDIPLAAGYGLQTVITAGTDTITIIKNPYQDLLISPAPPEALIVGIACSAIPASQWGWVQTWGPAAVLVTGTEVIGGRVSASGTVTNTTGAIEATGVLITTTAPTIAQMTEILEVGWCMEIAPDTGLGAIFLKIS